MISCDGQREGARSVPPQRVNGGGEESQRQRGAEELRGHTHDHENQKHCLVATQRKHEIEDIARVQDFHYSAEESNGTSRQSNQPI